MMARRSLSWQAMLHATLGKRPREEEKVQTRVEDALGHLKPNGHI
jgi:hypothetical protein